jgi:hypothetical protein
MKKTTEQKKEEYIERLTLIKKYFLENYKKWKYFLKWTIVQKLVREDKIYEEEYFDQNGPTLTIQNKFTNKESSIFFIISAGDLRKSKIHFEVFLIIRDKSIRANSIMSFVASTSDTQEIIQIIESNLEKYKDLFC